MNKLILPLCLVLDDMSRSKLNVSSSLSELLQYDVRVVRSLRDLTDEHFTRKIVLLEDFIRKTNCYSDLVLYKSVFNLDYIYIGLDEVLLKSMSDIAECHKMDPQLITYEQLYGIYYKDPAVISKYQEKERDSEILKFARQVIDDSEMDEKVKRLADDYLSLRELISHSLENISDTKNLVSELSVALQASTSRSGLLYNHYMDLVNKSIQLNRSLRQYEVILSKDVYDKIDISRYNTRPNIVYLKEYQELQNLDMFLKTVVSMFKIQHKMSAKVLLLLDSSSSKRIMTLPQDYTQLYNKFPRRILLEKDFLVKVGSYKEILETFLINETGLDVLVVVDCKNHLDTVLSGMFLKLSMCSSSANMEVFGLNPDSTIVNDDKNNRLCWENYSQVDTMTSQEDKFMFLSSRPLIQDIYKSCMSFG